MLVDWTDSWVQRRVKEPDGFIGWPKGDGGGGDSNEYSADSLLGEAMALRPAVLMAGEILRTPALKEKWSGKAQSYLELAERTFEKWDSRDCWREVKNGGVWVVPAFGIDKHTGQWSAGYARRKTDGFSNPDNKQNHIARWLVALHDVTKKPIYRERADKWFQLMKARMRTRDDGKYFVWNYWEPAGPWDYKSDGSPRHWVGVHPNGGYYEIDVEGIVTAYEHDLVFSREDIDRLIATNRDFMWNHQIQGAKFQRIDGGEADPRWKNSPGVLWAALLPYDETLRKIFVANHEPASWGGTVAPPRRGRVPFDRQFKRYQAARKRGRTIQTKGGMPADHAEWRGKWRKKNARTRVMARQCFPWFHGSPLPPLCGLCALGVRSPLFKPDEAPGRRPHAKGAKSAKENAKEHKNPESFRGCNASRLIICFLIAFSFVQHCNGWISPFPEKFFGTYFGARHPSGATGRTLQQS